MSMPRRSKAWRFCGFRSSPVRRPAWARLETSYCTPSRGAGLRVIKPVKRTTPPSVGPLTVSVPEPGGSASHVSPAPSGWAAAVSMRNVAPRAVTVKAPPSGPRW